MLTAITKITGFRISLIRSIHGSYSRWLKEIYTEKKDEKTTVVGARIIESPRVPYLLNIDRKDGKCPLCQLKLNLKYTDVLILSQYINSKGEILPKFSTSLCRQQYKLVRELIFMAQYAGLLPEPQKEEPKKPYRLLNTYYDEKTITLVPKTKKWETKLKHIKAGPIQNLRIRQ